jgi:hypothetical protein
MPHVVLNGNMHIESIFNKLNTLFIRKGTKILRTMDIYLERGKNAILIESLAIESGSKISFNHDYWDIRRSCCKIIS